MRFLGILLLCACAWGQTDGITTSVSRTVVIPADEARFTLQATVPSVTTAEQVVQALPGIGLQISDLVGQSTTNNTGPTFPNGPTLNAIYNFAFTRPVEGYSALSTKLETLRRSPPLGFSIQYTAALGPSAAAVETARRSVLPNLLADARSKALSMANAANLTLGALRSISDIGDSTTVAIIGDFSTSSSFRTTYSLTVRFAAQ